MAKKEIVTTTKKRLVKCMECAHGYLMQKGSNPIVAECRVRGGERFVATTDKVCTMYEPRRGNIVINPMKPAM